MYRIQNMYMVWQRDMASQKEQENAFRRLMVQTKLRTACTLHLVSCIGSSRFTFITPKPLHAQWYRWQPRTLACTQKNASKQVRVCSLPACTPGCLLLGSAAGECLWLMSHWAEQQVWKVQIHLAGSWPAALVPAPGMGSGWALGFSALDKHMRTLTLLNFLHHTSVLDNIHATCLLPLATIVYTPIHAHRTSIMSCFFSWTECQLRKQTRRDTTAQLSNVKEIAWGALNHRTKFWSGVRVFWLVSPIYVRI